MSKLDELLIELEATEADLSQRTTVAQEAAYENRRKKERALQAFQAAVMANDTEAKDEAAHLIHTLEQDFELLAAEAGALLQALEGKGNSPLRPICLAIKKEAELAAQERQSQWEQHAARLQALAADYLAEVASMGKLYQTGAGHQWERAKNFLPRGEDMLTGATLPAVVHETQRGDIYALLPKIIERTFRERKVVQL
ncbi:MAG: hypothetical protein KKC30_10575 [Proteobacteria bacterium]|nr:hypothetical protein [Pseudomonadota bacterium]MBU4385339.1 hypothetical protein [Pseudomonadota bacterium]MCG2764531.1 hypothetical protein [Desulfarculaceae bacterium]